MHFFVALGLREKNILMARMKRIQFNQSLLLFFLLKVPFFFPFPQTFPARLFYAREAQTPLIPVFSLSRAPETDGIKRREVFFLEKTKKIGIAAAAFSAFISVLCRRRDGGHSLRQLFTKSGIKKLLG